MVARRAHPVAHRFVGRVAQGPRAGRHRHDRRPQRPHVEDVELLAADVFLAHVDRAFDAEEGAGRRRGDAVLAGAGLGDHPRLVHPLGQHDLADGVVDLVGAGVVQVLALQVDLGPAGVFREPLGVKERRRAADVVLQVIVQPRLKLGIGLRLLVGRGELIERVHQRFGHEPAAERAEPAQDVGP